MKRQTLLEPEDQWSQSVSYLSMLHRTKWMRWEHWRQIYAFKVKCRQAPYVPEELLRETWKRELIAGPLVDNRDCLVVVTSAHRLAAIGDVLVASMNNGMGARFPVFGVSSKGRRLSHYWMPYEDASSRHGIMRIIELPGDLIGRRWDDPAIGRFVVDLRRRLP